MTTAHQNQHGIVEVFEVGGSDFHIKLDQTKEFAKRIRDLADRAVEQRLMERAASGESVSISDEDLRQAKASLAAEITLGLHFAIEECVDEYLCDFFCDLSQWVEVYVAEHLDKKINDPWDEHWD